MVGGDHGLALAGQVPASFAEHFGGAIETLGHRFEGAGIWRRPDHPGQDPLLEEVSSTEEHFPFIGEVTEEGAFGQSRSRRDLGGGGLVEPPLGEEGKGRFL